MCNVNFDTLYEKIWEKLKKMLQQNPDLHTEINDILILLWDLKAYHYKSLHQDSTKTASISDFKKTHITSDYTENLIDITLANLKAFQKTTTDLLIAEALEYLIMLWGYADEDE